MDEIKYVVDAKPEIVGTAGKAWQMDMESFIGRHPEQMRGGDICTWIIHAPFAHGMWSYYFLACIVLRPIEGFPPARIYLQGATHEVFLYALNPEKTPTLNEFNSMLDPVNYAGQWIETDDEAAKAKVRKAVEDICNGMLSPDTDFRFQWIERFGDSMMKDR